MSRRRPRPASGTGPATRRPEIRRPEIRRERQDGRPAADGRGEPGRDDHGAQRGEPQGGGRGAGRGRDDVHEDVVAAVHGVLVPEQGEDLADRPPDRVLGIRLVPPERRPADLVPADRERGDHGNGDDQPADWPRPAPSARLPGARSGIPGAPRLTALRAPGCRCVRIWRRDRGVRVLGPDVRFRHVHLPGPSPGQTAPWPPHYPRRHPRDGVGSCCRNAP